MSGVHGHVQSGRVFCFVRHNIGDWSKGSVPSKFTGLGGHRATCSFLSRGRIRHVRAYATKLWQARDTWLPAAKKEKTCSRWQEVKNVTRLRLEEVWSILITSVTVHAQLGHSELFKYGTLWARTPPASLSYARYAAQPCLPKFKVLPAPMHKLYFFVVMHSWWYLQLPWTCLPWIECSWNVCMAIVWTKWAFMYLLSLWQNLVLVYFQSNYYCVILYLWLAENPAATYQ